MRKHSVEQLQLEPSHMCQNILFIASCFDTHLLGEIVKVLYSSHIHFLKEPCQQQQYWPLSVVGVKQPPLLNQM